MIKLVVRTYKMISRADSLHFNRNKSRTPVKFKLFCVGCVTWIGLLRDGGLISTDIVGLSSALKLLKFVDQNYSNWISEV